MPGTQGSFSRSIVPIVTPEHAITRCAVATKAESDSQEGGTRTTRRKFNVLGPGRVLAAHANRRDRLVVLAIELEIAPDNGRAMIRQSSRAKSCRVDVPDLCDDMH